MEEYKTVANDALEQSLRAEIDKHFNARLDELRSEITRIQNLLNEAVAQHQTDTDAALAKLSESVSDDHEAMVMAIAEQLKSEGEAQDLAPPTPTSDTNASASVSVIRNAIVDLYHQKTQAEILKTLVGYSASLAPRVAFFIVKEGHTKGWRARGLEDTVGNDAVSSIALPLSEHTPLSEAVKTQETWVGEPGYYQDDYKLLSGLGAVTPKRIVTIPLVARGKSVAVLYADSGRDDAGVVDIEALESLVKVAGLNVELAAGAKTAAKPHPVQPAEPAPAVEPQPEPVSEPAPMAQPETVEETTPYEPIYEPAPIVPEPAPEVSFMPPPPPPLPEEKSFDFSGYTTNPTIEEPPAIPYTAPIETYAPVERPTYSPATPQQPLPPIPQSSTATTRSYGRKDIELPIEVNDEERRYHNEARRFARLLVSEIKLYNEPKVKEGREARDLYDRLREAIDRSREMYDKRVDDRVASRFDYFHFELVNTLAEGDEGKLGSDYPGANV